MGLLSKLRWLGVGASLWSLKKLLAYRINGESATWLQDIPMLKAILVNRESYIVKICENKSVWHVGFSDFPFTKEKLDNGTLLHERIKSVAKSLVGVDINQEAIEAYHNRFRDAAVACVDITQPIGLIGGDINLILLGEVLEHLKDPHQAIQNIYHSANDKTEIVVTVPNYTSLDSLSATTANEESVHPHHYWYFSPYTLLKLFPEDQFACREILFGTYDEFGKQPNAVRNQYPFTGDCIIAIFAVKK